MNDKIAAANAETKKLFKWLIMSGSTLTALNAANTLLNALVAGQINWKEFASGLFYTVAFALINTAIYYVAQLKSN